jgi:hypothetical protein
MLHEEWPNLIRKIEPNGIVGFIGILMGDILKISEVHLVSIVIAGL